ncbi:alpha/beta hydrolase [Flavobacterium sp. HSC-61S13]|uniref:alpha/beta hydrolase n=1 Tax=Flavobacterium sp. HSC-61S13 TaxID=2910963 RepID=UPI00209FEEF4|nr:alpha/beta hydrolase-fold protein [Flavobacterium sp. HSC-61S13]MCP1994660.1 putative alpha/beta superfamily hydrolase [Flavobacterium sp. HSC-61S13]
MTKFKLVLVPLILLTLISCQIKKQLHSEKTNSITAKNPDKDFKLGKVVTLYSESLQEDRTLNIYLPENYDIQKTYPVIYLLDGGADEDFIHIVGLVQYNTFPWIDRIPQSIVVGIANTKRKRDFTATTQIESQKKMIPDFGGSEKFIDFVETELQPYVEKNYSTNTSKTIIGQSLGGLLATEILFTKPRLFDKYIIISPSLWWNDGYLLTTSPEVLQADYNHPTAVYIGVGKEGSIDGSKNHIMEEDAQLLATKIKSSPSKNIEVFFDFLPEEDHATVTHPAVFNAFRVLYPKK